MGMGMNTAAAAQVAQANVLRSHPGLLSWSRAGLGAALSPGLKSKTQNATLFHKGRSKKMLKITRREKEKRRQLLFIYLFHYVVLNVSL